MNELIPEEMIVEYFEQKFLLGKAIDISMVRQSQNDVYRVRTRDQQYALKVYLSHRSDISDVNSIKQQHQFAAELRDAGIYAERACENIDNTTVGILKVDGEKRFVCVYNWEDGEPLTAELKPAQINSIGGAIIQIFELGNKRFPLRYRNTMDAAKLVHEPKRIIESAIQEFDNADFQPLVNAINQVADKVDSFDYSILCNCVVHGDMNPSNMLYRNDGIVLLDFDNCCNASPLWDLTVLNACLPSDAFNQILYMYDPEMLHERNDASLWTIYRKAMSIWKFAYIIGLDAIKTRGIMYEKGMTRDEVRQNMLSSWTKYILEVCS